MVILSISLSHCHRNEQGKWWPSPGRRTFLVALISLPTWCLERQIKSIGCGVCTQDNATYAKVPASTSLDAFLDGMEAATEKLEVLSAIGQGGWKVQGRRLQSAELQELSSAQALSPVAGHVLVLHSHLHSLISQAPGPGRTLQFPSHYVTFPVLKRLEP